MIECVAEVRERCQKNMCVEPSWMETKKLHWKMYVDSGDRIVERRWTVCIHNCDPLHGPFLVKLSTVSLIFYQSLSGGPPSRLWRKKSGGVKVIFRTTRVELWLFETGKFLIAPIQMWSTWIWKLFLRYVVGLAFVVTQQNIMLFFISVHNRRFFVWFARNLCFIWEKCKQHVTLSGTWKLAGYFNEN